MKIHAEYNVTKYHYDADGELVADTALLIGISLCHDDCPDTFNETTIRLSEPVLGDGWSRSPITQEEIDEATESADQHRRPSKARRLH